MTSLQHFYTHPSQKDHDGKQRDVYLWPPKELCPQQDKIWRLKKAMCELRSSPKAWQDYLAEVLQKLSFVRLKSEPNVYTNATRDCYIMVYVDDLLVLGDKTLSTPPPRPFRSRSYSSTSATSNLANHNNFFQETSTTLAIITAILD